MKKFAIIAALALCSLAAQAAPDEIKIERRILGSGEQGVTGLENAKMVGDYGVYHAPQYLPGYPTAASIWPRVVEVKCNSKAECEGYNWLPEMGRGEYLYIKPVLVAAPVPAPVFIPQRIITPPPVELKKRIRE